MKIPNYLQQKGVKQIVSLDYETYFDTKYQLRKISITEYIRNEKFKIHGVGICCGNQRKSKWFTKTNILEKINWEKTALLCHHTHFDGLILSHHFGIKPAFYLDTLSMSRFIFGLSVKHDLNSLSERYKIGNKTPDILEKTKGILDLDPSLLKELGDYCNNDVNIMDECFNLMIKNYPNKELDVIDMTISMFTDPRLKVNRKIVKEEIQRERRNKNDLIKKCGKSVNEKLLQSNEKFANYLRTQGIEPSTKISSTTNKQTYSFAKTDSGFSDLLKNSNENIQNIAAARLAVKSTLIETRANSLLIRTPNNESLPIYLNYNGGHTGRFSGGDKLNPQNFPSTRTKSKLRLALEAPKGYVLGIVDASQIEARLNAWFCEQDDVLELFAKGEDPYKHMAATIYGKPIDEITEEERFIGKTAVLGLGYQCGADKYKTTLEMGILGPSVKKSLIECKQIVNTFRQKNYSIKEEWYTLRDFLWEMYDGCSFDYKCLKFLDHHIIFPNGKHLIYNGLDYEGLNSKKKKLYDVTYQFRPNKREKIYGGKMLENIIQGLANVIITDQMLTISKKYKPVMMTHDEVICLIPEKQADKGLDFMINIFKIPPTWAPDLPLDAEGGVSKNYSK